MRTSERSRSISLPLRVLTVLLVAVLAALVVIAAGIRLPERPDLPTEAVLAADSTTPLDRTISAAELQHPGESAFRLVSEGQEAFVLRDRSAALAGRSLDIQTYIWRADTTGILLGHRLLQAADRGVRVRLLVDDLDARAKNAGFAALAAHPNIDVRLFNPFGSRNGTLGLIGEGIANFGRINRRMHNKTWIADNRIALAGGRNLGDEYFNARQNVNFVDLDIVMIGPIVRDASASFDRYWNAPVVYPIELLDPDGTGTEQLAKLRVYLGTKIPEAEQGPYAQALRQNEAVMRLARGDIQMEWTANYEFVADDPLKILRDVEADDMSNVLASIYPAMTAARSSLTILSPYFVPGDRATARMVAAASRDLDVRILTNSLASNDVAAVHGGYSRYRLALLKGGVHLWELKPSGRARSSFLGSSGASLHTKAFTVDERLLFVGSFNLDPRSARLNCEQGVLVESAVLARQLDAIFATQTTGDHAWQLTVVDNELRWSDGREQLDDEPDASVGRRLQAWLARVLQIDSQL